MVGRRFLVALLVAVTFVAGCVEGDDEPRAAVSEADAITALESLRSLAAERTPEAMEQVCAMSLLNGCNGLSSAVVAYPESAPGPQVPPPTVLCSRDAGQGAWMLIVEGADGYGRPYVSQVVLDRDADGAVVPLHEAAFWLGIAYDSSKVTGSTALTAAYSAQDGAVAKEHTEEVLRRARLACTK